MAYRIRRPDAEEGTQSSENNGSGNSSMTKNDERWAQRTLRDVLMEAYQEQRRARLWRNIWRGVAAVLFIAIFFGGRGGDKESSKAAFAAIKGNHTAVINLEGEIGGKNDQVDILRRGMEAAYKNRNAKAIVIRANSPGGSPVVSNIAFAEIRRMKEKHKNIPVYVVAEDMCASGCYYIAAAADKIYADPSSLIGSIGVIGSSFDATGLMDKLGVKRRVRIAGNNKGMGDPFTEETPEQQAIWQQMLSQIHEEFIKAVREGRGKKLQEAAYPDLYSGRIFTGVEAKKAGLIDDYGNVYSIARDVVKAPELVNYTPEDDDLKKLLSRHFGAQVEQKIHDVLHRFW
ncbi:S49 family peptidase [Wielerella bovis]|uniref:S49 family peptidase n=1 Tax=Wielerella bovis TaxID=2917790 RepID=UPI003D28A24B